MSGEVYGIVNIRGTKSNIFSADLPMHYLGRIYTSDYCFSGIQIYLDALCFVWCSSHDRAIHLLFPFGVTFFAGCGQ